jgi:uncharacterized protein (DUF3084 family)
MANDKSLAEECDDLRQQLATAQARLKTIEEERAHLTSELAIAQKDRDEFQRAVHFLTQREFCFTREDIAEAETNGLSFEQLKEGLENTAHA